MGVKVREKRGAWWLFIDYKGKRKAKRVGFGVHGRKAAEAAAIQIQAKLASGDTTPLSENAVAPVVTFGDYADRWLAEAIVPHRKARTEDYYRQMLKNHLTPSFGKKPLAEIKPTHVRSFVAEKVKGGASRNTVKNMAATLRAVLYQAQVDELIASNPAARFGRFFDARHDPREHVTVLNAQDVAKILKAAAKWYPDHEVLVATLFYTGMREGEALGVQWQDFDWQRNLVDLRRTVGVRKGRLVVNTPKSGKLRTVDLPSFLTSRVRELKSIRGAQAVVAGKCSRRGSSLPSPIATSP